MPLPLTRPVCIALRKLERVGANLFYCWFAQNIESARLVDTKSSRFVLTIIILHEKRFFNFSHPAMFFAVIISFEVRLADYRLCF